MEINVLRKMDYKEHIIYVMQFFNVFQYLFCDKNGNIYQDHIVIRPNIFSLIGHKLGFRESRYTKEELEYGEDIALDGAVKSVDALLIKVKEYDKKNG